MDEPPESPTVKHSSTFPASDPAQAAALFEQSVAIMARLRAPGGCPWDREQTFDTIRKYTLEEAYEVFDAIERRDFPHLAEELGDLLLQVLFYAEMAANEGHFTICRRARPPEPQADPPPSPCFRGRGLARGRQPGQCRCRGAGVQPPPCSATGTKSRRRRRVHAARPGQNRHSRLDTVQRAMPALAEAAKLGSKAAKAGFDWPHWRDLLPKLVEETAELEAEASPGRTIAPRPPSKRNWAICSSPSSTWAGIWASTRRWLCAAAICASGSVSGRWNWPRPTPRRSFPGRAGSALGRRQAKTRTSTEARASRIAQLPGGAAMILIRACEGFDELEACVQLQVETWGYDQTRRHSAQGISGDAEDWRAGDRRLRHRASRRFAPGRPGINGRFRHVFARRESRAKKTESNPRPYLHSHMLAVRRSLPQSRPWRATQAGTTT